MSQSRQSIELDGKAPPRNTSEWHVWNAKHQMRLQRVREAKEAAQAREQETADRQYMIDRSNAYALLGVAFDRSGIARWIANGQPVIGGRKPGDTGWQRPPAFG